MNHNLILKKKETATSSSSSGQSHMTHCVTQLQLRKALFYGRFSPLFKEKRLDSTVYSVH